MPVKEVSMVPVRFTIPQVQADKVHALVECGDYPADAEVYRDAVREFLEKRKSHSAVQTEGEPCPASG